MYSFMTLQKDQTEVSREPVRVFEMGEWFTPLPDLAKQVGGASTRLKYSFDITNFGHLNFDFTHDDDYYKQLKVNKRHYRLNKLLALPNRVELITNNNIYDWQKELETSIINFEGLSLISGSLRTGQYPNSDEHPITSPTYLEVDLPAGIVLRAPFMDFNPSNPPVTFQPYPHIGALGFIWKGNSDNSGLLFPDGKLITQNTHFRIVEE